MAAQVLTPEDLRKSDFRVGRDGKIAINSTLENYTAEFATPGRWDTIDNWNPADRGNRDRRSIQILNGIGKIHLDFKAVKDIGGGGTYAFKLPANCPKSEVLIESQTHDGGSIWISGNSDKIYVANLRAGTRYIVDIIGFFKSAG